MAADRNVPMLMQSKALEWSSIRSPEGRQTERDWRERSHRGSGGAAQAATDEVGSGGRSKVGGKAR